MHDAVQLGLCGETAHAKATGSGGAGDGGNHRGQQTYQQGGVYASHDEPVVEQLSVPVEGEALPHGGAVSLVEGKDDEHHDGNVKEEEDEA